MKYVYTAILEPDGSQYNVSFPDIPECVTCGDNLTDAISMAEDALSLWLTEAEESGDRIPVPSESVPVPEGSRSTLICADTEAYRKKTSAESVRKNVTLPAWLASLAEKQNINFSQTLQNALKRELNI